MWMRLLLCCFPFAGGVNGDTVDSGGCDAFAVAAISTDSRRTMA